MIDVQAAVFDVDGTLVNSLDSITRAWTAWAQEFGVDLTSLQNYHGLPSRDIVARLVPEELAFDAWRRVDALEVAEAHDIPAYPGAKELLGSIAPERVAIATSGTRAVEAERLRAAGITPPRVFVTVDDISNGKPDPEIFQIAALGLGVEPTDCVVFEDSVAGVQAAKAAGCACVAVLTTTSREELETAGADIVVASLADVVVVHVDGRLRLSIR